MTDAHTQLLWSGPRQQLPLSRVRWRNNKRKWEGDKKGEGHEKDDEGHSCEGATHAGKRSVIDERLMEEVERVEGRTDASEMEQEGDKEGQISAHTVLLHRLGLACEKTLCLIFAL